MPNKNHQLLTVNKTLTATANAFTVNVWQFVKGKKSQMIIRQLQYSNIAGADSGIYLIWCSLTSNYIGSVYVGIQGVSLTPGTTLSLPENLQSMDFRIVPANGAFTGPTGQFCMTLEFID